MAREQRRLAAIVTADVVGYSHAAYEQIYYSSLMAQQKEATRRRAQGATLQELADSYDRSIATMRRATRAA